MRRLILVAALPLSACGAPSGPSAPATGVAALSTCTACHALTADAPRRSAPTLAGVVGRRAGALPHYPYSPALKGSGVVWSKATLARFLTNPAAMVPGTRMVARVADPAQRARVVDALAGL
jgi:cytochrome c